MAETTEEALKERLEREAARSMRQFADLQSRLVGYEIAITALIGALDRCGALPLHSAKSAIEDAIAGLAEGPLISTEPLKVLRQLSARLEPAD
jgi:hypothetical protein